MDQETSLRMAGDFSGCLPGLLLRNACLRALAIDTKIPPAIRDMQGMSGRKYRYLINNLVEATKAPRYLEIGSWTGSTACAALFGNDCRALCIDNWSEFGGPREVFLQNMAVMKTTAVIDFSFIEADYRQVDYTGIGSFNLFLFDGPHSEQDQADGITLPKPAMDKMFTLVIDDWNWERVRLGTRKAIGANGLEVLCSIEIRTTQDDSHPEVANQLSDWHNGYFLAVCRKP